MYVEIPGELYLRLLKLIIIPLLVSNVILSFGTLKGKLSSQLGKIAGFLYLSTNLMAIIIAIVLVLLICPGKKPEAPTEGSTKSDSDTTVKPPKSYLQLDNSLLFHHHYHRRYSNNEYHDSMRRFKNYRPLFLNRDQYVEIPDVLIRKNSPMHSWAHTTKTTTTNDTIITLIEVSEFAHQHQHSMPNPILQPEQVAEHLLAKVPNRNASMFNSDDHRFGLNTKLPVDVLLDMLRNLVPDSIIGATLQQSRTRLYAPLGLVIGINGSTNPPPSRWPIGHEMVDQANIIGLLAISVLTGVVLSHMESASRPLLDLCACISELSLRIGMMATNLAPFCIMFLLIGQVARARDLGSVAGELFMYTLTVIIALILFGFVLMPLLYYLILKRSPVEFLLNMHEAMVSSFATSSSSASMALMLNCLNKMEMNPVIVGAFGPLGSVFNMNGTAIFEAIGAIFIAQTLGLTLPPTSLLLVGLSSAVASFSTSGIPSSGMMTMVIVLNAINLPVLQLSLIYIVDFIIDRFRTVVNVWSGAVVCALIDHICPKDLFEDEMEPHTYREIMDKYRSANKSLVSKIKTSSKKETAATFVKPQFISVTITPPDNNNL